MQKTNETTRIVDVKHLCMSDNVDEAVRKAYDLAQSIMANMTDLCGAVSQVEDDKLFRKPVHNISLNAQMIMKTLNKYVEE